MTTIKKAVAAVLRAIGLKSWADTLDPPASTDGAGGTGPLPPPKQ